MRVMAARGTHLVRLHRFQHAEAADVDNANLVALTGARVEVHQRHNVLRVLSVRAIGSDVHNLQRKLCLEGDCESISARLPRQWDGDPSCRCPVQRRQSFRPCRQSSGCRLSSSESRDVCTAKCSVRTKNMSMCFFPRNSSRTKGRQGQKHDRLDLPFLRQNQAIFGVLPFRQLFPHTFSTFHFTSITLTYRFRPTIGSSDLSARGDVAKWKTSSKTGRKGFDLWKF